VSLLPSRLLVVGGNGFIGRHVVEHAQSLGWAVTSLSLSKPKGEASKDVVHAAADISDLTALQKVLRETQFDYVVNCGGYVDHKLFSGGGRELLDSHFGGLLNLIELLDRDILKGFVNIGSSDEYGVAPAPQAEDLRESPISPYSSGKVAATHFLQMMHRTESFPVTTLRLFLTYGPGQDNRRFLPQIINGCLEDNSFPTSAGEQLRDFCYVDDTVKAIFAALLSTSAKGEVVNIASGQPVSIRHMIEKVCQLVGGGAPQFGSLPYRPGENMELYADISKARDLFGWRPATSLDAGLSRTIDWTRSQS
jgi:nucleoside-diphosphate-sugar epimerase